MCISWISIYFRRFILNKDNFFQNLLKGILAPAARLSVAQQVGTNKLFGNNQPVNDTLAQSILGNKVYQDVEQQPLKEGLFKSMLSAATTGAGFALPFSQYKAIPRLAGNVGLGALGGYSGSSSGNEAQSAIQGGVLGGVLGEVVPLVLNKGNSTLRELSNKYGFREGNLDRYRAYLKIGDKKLSGSQALTENLTVSQNEGPRNFSNLAQKVNLDDYSIKRLLIKNKLPDVVYRGVQEAGDNDGAAMFGRGLYTTPSRKIASQYGKVIRLGKEALPENPLQFSSPENFSQFEHEISKRLGVGKRDLYGIGGGVDDLIRALGYDGLTIGTGKERYIVKF